jgi:hypothetical protein
MVKASIGYYKIMLDAYERQWVPPRPVWVVHEMLRIQQVIDSMTPAPKQEARIVHSSDPDICDLIQEEST